MCMNLVVAQIYSTKYQQSVYSIGIVVIIISVHHYKKKIYEINMIFACFFFINMI